MPRAEEFEYLRWPGPIAFAHRGGASEVPENTMPAFEHAVRLGYRYVETDVHVTADGVLLAFHDDVLDRVTDRTGAVGELPWSVVSEAKVDGIEPIPLLEDLLGAFTDLRVNIDPKHDAAVEPLAEVLRRCDAVDRVRIGAFDDIRLERVRALLPGVRTSLGPIGTLQLGMASTGQEIAELPSPCAQVPPSYADTEIVTEAFLDEAHGRGMQVHVWTIDDADEMTRLLDLGVDGLMTDRPAVLRDVLESRGSLVLKLPLTPLDFLARARRLFPERLGIVQGDDLRMTYGEFGRRCDGLAALLAHDLGVQPGDRVAFLAGNVHQLLEAYYGVLLAGGVLLPLNIRCAPAELAEQLVDAEASVLVADPSIPAPAFSGPVVGLDAWSAAPPDQPFPVPEVDEDAPAELFYTSGSTGVPKGALLSHRALYLHAVHNALTNAITGDDVVLHTIPLFHVNGWGTPHFLTGLGGVHVCLPRFDAAEVLRLVERERVSRLFLVPTMAQLLLDCPDVATRDLSSVQQVSIGGAPSTPALLADVEDAFGCTAICGYGMTESSPTLTRSLDKPGAAPSRAKRATTGLPIIGVDLRVLDDDDVEVPWDGATVGEVCARSNHVMVGYWRRPEETADALRGGWLRTGDLAVVDGDGYVQIVDRRKDLIVSGGENIASPEVERALAAHPAVREVAVVGMPDERWGEVPAAFVAFHAGTSATEEELVAWVQERLARFKAPRRIVVLDALPIGGTGKVSKADLRARLRQQDPGVQDP